jgi:tetratricopeptide (TPR) repeat protein
MAVVLTASFAFLIAMSERRIPSSYLACGVLLLTSLILHSLLLSVDLGRSLEFLPMVWAYYCLLGYFMYAGMRMTEFATAVVVLCVIVSGYGIYQYFWGFEQLYNYVFYSGSDEIVKTPALTTIAAERVFSTLALPGTLWGFLVLALPIHGILWKRNRLIDLGLFVSVTLLLACGLLTRSFGFLVGIFVLAAGALIIQHRKVFRERLAILAGIVLVLVMLGSIFYSMRLETIENANPFSLRFKNWIGAWNIFAVNPLGTGLNTFAVAYPQFMLPGSNETQYAHNTPLQIMSELGFPAILAFFVLIVYLVQTRRSEDFGENTRYLALGLFVWLFHNLIDINVYFPSLGVMGAVLTGVLLARPQREPVSASKPLVAAAWVITLCIVILAAPMFVSNELLHRADIELENGKLAESIATLETAKQFNPLNSSLYHVTGETSLELFHKTQKQEYLQLAQQSFERAIELSPLKVGPHVGLGLCLSTANRMEDALREIEIAQRLYPNSAYVRSVEVLMQRRIQGEFAR